MTTPDEANDADVTVATLPAGKLTRTDVARELGVSVSSIRRLEGKSLHPEVGPGNIRLFDRADIEVLRTTKLRVTATATPSAADDGDLAADVFAMFDDDVHPVDVVKRMRLAPSIVEAMHAQWTRMRRKLCFDVHDIERTVGRDWAPDHPREAEVLECMREIIKGTCEGCGNGIAAWCRKCFCTRTQKPPAKRLT